ncbi:hypothetical protein GALL_441430 [mine drainage metagenome]|uniref:Uncharacterized protein n=1 Tax=mine drainage metagenome TaxID=410659 RepID=A0A1J5PSV4_9ZZZZ
MYADSEELNLIKRLCILNFLELQEIKRHLNISTANTQEFYDYQNAVSDYMKELDDKMRSLIKDYPHLWDGK